MVEAAKVEETEVKRIVRRQTPEASC